MCVEGGGARYLLALSSQMRIIYPAVDHAINTPTRSCGSALTGNGGGTQIWSHLSRRDPPSALHCLLLAVSVLILI